MIVKSLITTCFSIIAFSIISAQKADSLKTISIDTVTVSAFRVKSNLKEMPQTVIVLQKKDINEIPNESLDELLKKTAGVDVIEYTGFLSNIGMRGFAPSAFNGTYTLVLENGLPTGTENPSTLDLNSAQQVEVLKGPYSSFFGSGAMAGVINLVTPMSNDIVSGKAGLTLGSFDTYALKVSAGGAVTGKLNFDFSAKMLHENTDYKTGSSHLLNFSSTERQIMDVTYGKIFPNTTYGKYDANLRIGYSLVKNWQINLYENVFDADPIYDNGNFWGVYGSTKKTIQRWSQSLSLTGQSGNQSFKFAPYYSNENTNYYNNATDTNFIENKVNYQSYGFILQDGIKLGNHFAILGIDNHSQNYVNEVFASANKLTVPYQPNYLNSPFGAFLQIRFNFFDNKLTSAIGGRYDLIYFAVYKTDSLPSSKNTSVKYKTFNPNINLKYNFSPRFNIHGSAGTAFLAPTAFEKAGIYATPYGVYEGNPDLKPETSTSFDIGLTYDHIRDGITAGITFFNNIQKGMIGYNYSKVEVDTISFLNASSAISNGIECTLAYDFGSLAEYRYSLRLYGNLTHLFKSDVTSGGITSPIKYVRKDNASFGLEYHDFKSFSLRLNGRFIGHRYEDNWLIGYDNIGNPIPLTTSNGTAIRPSLINDPVLRLPDFMVFDFSLNYIYAKKYNFGLVLQNFLDENYTEKDAYNMPGRTITVIFNYLF